jgi:alpha-ribazole phosphatase
MRNHEANATEANQRLLTVYLIRHTEVGSPPGVCYGRTDVPLHPDCETHIASTLAKLPATVTARASVWSSPAQRCAQLAGALDRRYLIDARLREFDFGHWEGLNWDKLPRNELDGWSADLEHYEVPGGESLRAVQDRTTAALGDAVRGLASGGEEVPLVVVSHGGVIRALVAHALEMPLSGAFRLQVDYGSVSCLEHRAGGWRLNYLNH